MKNAVNQKLRKNARRRPQVYACINPAVESLEGRTLMAGEPSDFVAVASSTSGINLTWTDNATNETHFILDRSTDGVNFRRIASIGADSTSFSDSGLSPNTQYYYRIKAITSTVNSNWSRASGTTLPIIPPAAPSSFVAAGTSISQIGLSWTDEATDETHFLIERSTDGRKFRRVASLPADSTSFTDSGLTLGAQYQYRVKSANAVATSRWVYTSGTPQLPVTPAAPSSFTATAASTSQLNLSWTDNATSETHFIIDRSIDGVTFQRIASVAADSTSYVDSGLSSGTTYYYAIKAIGLLENSRWVRTSGTTETPPPPPAPPPPPPATIGEDFASNSDNFTPVEGTWGVVAGVYAITSPSSAATTHLNNRSVHSTWLDGDFTLDVDAATENSSSSWNDFAVIFGYQDADNYYYVSSNESNDGGTSGLFKVVNGVRTELDDIAVAIAGGTQYHLRMERVGGTINAYRNGALVASATDSTFLLGRVGFGTQNDAATFDNLVVNGTVGQEPQPPTTVPTAPTELTAIAASSTTVELTWSDNSTDEASFRVERSDDGGATWTLIATRAPNTTAYTVGGLSAATTYHFRVRAYNIVGYSSWTNVASATTDEAPQVGAQPGPDNTGVTDPSLLRPSGSVSVYTAGAVIENLDITGGITINAPNVTVRNCRINAQGVRYAIRVAYDLTGRTIIEDCEIFNMDGFAIHGENFTARRLNIHHSGSDGINITTDGLVESCWFHHLGMNDGAHADGVQIASGTNHVIRGNFFDMPKGYTEGSQEFRSNAAIMIKPSGDYISNVLIEGNWMNAGNYTIYITTAADYGRGMPTGCVVRNNWFGRDFNFGVKYFSDASLVVWENNRWMDTGELIP